MATRSTSLTILRPNFSKTTWIGCVDAYLNPPLPRWTIAVGCPEVTIAHDGQFAVVSGDLDHPDYDEIGGNDACLGGDNPVQYVFDREGTLVLKWPADADKQGLASAVFDRTGKRLNLTDPSASWDWPFDDFLDTLASDPQPPVKTRQLAPQGYLLLASRDRELRLYRKQVP